MEFLNSVTNHLICGTLFNCSHAEMLNHKVKSNFQTYLYTKLIYWEERSAFTLVASKKENASLKTNRPIQ